MIFRHFGKDLLADLMKYNNVEEELKELFSVIEPT